MDTPVASETTSATIAVYQDGFNFLGSWDDTAGVIQPASDPKAFGLIFEFTATNLIYIPQSFTLGVYDGGSAESGAVSSVYVVPVADPDDYSSAAMPGSRSETTTDQLICRVTGDYRTGDLTWAFPGTFTYRFGYEWTDGAWAENTTFQANWQTYWGRYFRKSGNTKIALTVVNTSTQGVPFFYTKDWSDTTQHPYLTAEQFRAHGGHNVGGVGRHRATYCARSGIPMMTDELVEDGYLTGLWVHPDWYEAEDEDNHRRGPSSTERETDDRWGSDG